MYRDMKVAVVVPAHNEERLVGQVVRRSPEIVDHIIVVDDASADGTSEAARATGDPRLEVLRLAENQGVGGAIAAGHRRALELGADVSVVMAGDDQMDPAHLPALLDPIADGDAQFTKANRFYSYGSFAGMPRHRVVGNIVMSFLTKAASGYWGLFDPLNGYTALTQRAGAGRVRPRRQALRLRERPARPPQHPAGPARDVPIPAVYGDEVSGIRIGRVGWAMMIRLWTGFWRRIWRKYVLQSFSPVALLLFSGLFLLGIGSAVGVFVLVNTLGPPIASAGTVLLSVGPLLSGLHLLIFAMVLDIQEGTR